MNKRNFLLPSLLALAAFQGVSYAALLEIGVNFTGRNGPGNLPLSFDESAGFVPQTDWNNLGNNIPGEPAGNFQDPNFNLTSGPLFTNDGLAGSRGATGVTLTLVTNDSWNSDGASGTTDERLMKGFVKCSTGNTLTLTLNNLDPTKSYDFLAYTNVNNAGSQGNLTLSGVSNYATYYVTEDNAFDGTFTIGNSTDPGARSSESDYSIWNSVTPNASGNITLTIQHVTGGDGFGLSAFQLRELAPQIVGEAYWNFGAGTGNWDTVAVNWRGTNDAGASNASFATNNLATFGNLGTTGLRTVEIAAGGVSPGATVVNNAVGNDYVIQGGPILGAGTLTKDGPGSLTLTGANEFGGAVALKHGTINVTAVGDPATAGNLGKGPTISIGDVGTDDAVLNYGGPTSTVSRSLIMNDNGGTVNLSTAGVVLTMSNLSGIGKLTKSGPGDLVFTGINSTHTGGIAVNAGNLTVRTIGNGTTGQNLSLNGGTSFTVTGSGIQPDGRGLVLNGNASIGVTDPTASYALNGPLNSTNVLTKTGGGRLELGGAVTLTQLPVISGGTLAITGEGAIDLPNGGINLPSGQRLEVAPGALDAANPVTLNGGALRVGHQGLQAFYFTGGYDFDNWRDQMNGTAFGIASSHAALAGAGVTMVSARTITGGQSNLNFTNNNYSDQSAPFANQGVGDIDNIRAVFSGKIRIDSAGDTTFFTTSDDGSSIFIDGQRVVMNNEFQGPVTRQGTINLAPGLHDFLMYFYEGFGGAGLLAEYTPAGGTRQVIPNSILFSGDTVNYSATPIIVTAPSTIESGAAIAQLGALSLPSNTLLTINGSATFAGTTLAGANHQVAVTGFNANTSLGVLSGPTNLTKTGNGGLVFTAPPQANTTLTVNEGTLVSMGAAGTGDPLAGIPITFANNTALGLSSTDGDVTYNTPIPTGLNFTIAAGAFSNGNITTATQVTIAPAAIVAAAGTTLSLRSNNHNFTLAVTPQITGTGNVVTEEGTVVLNGGVNNVGGNFTNRIGNVTVNGNVSTNALLQEGNFQNHGNNLIAGQIVPGSTTITGNLSATSVTNTRGTLTVNGVTTNTGPLTLNGNGTTNLGASSHTFAELTGNAILNAVGAFASPGALTLSGGSTASLNSLASVSNVALNDGSSLVVRGTLDSLGGINAVQAGNVRFDAGSGNTATLSGGNVSLNNQSTVTISSGTADLSAVEIHAAPLDADLNLDALGARHIARPGGAIAVDPRTAATANNLFNGTTNPPVTANATLQGALNVGDDNAFNSLFGGGVDVNIFSAAFYGRYRPTADGSVEFSTLISDDQGAIWLDFNQSGTFEDAEKVVNVDGYTTTTVTGTTPFLTAGQYYNVLFGVQDTGGGSALHVHLKRPGEIASSTLNTLTPSGEFSYFSDNGAGGNLQVDGDATLITKSFDGVTNLRLGGGATLTLTNKVSSTASSADSLGATGFNANVFVGDNNVLTVGRLLVPGGGTLNIDNALGAINGGRVVVSGTVSSLAMDSDIGTGTVNVSGGQLIANSRIVGTGSINAQLSGVIGGTGTIATAVTISAGGTLAPGDPSVNDGIGKLTVGNLVSSGDFEVQLRNAGLNQFDQLSVVGSVDITNTVLALSLSPSFTAATNDVFALILNDGTDAVTGQFTTGTAITVGDHQFTISYNANLDGGGIGNDVALTYLVPEPGSAVMLLGGFATLIGFGRARRRV